VSASFVKNLDVNNQTDNPYGILYFTTVATMVSEGYAEAFPLAERPYPIWMTICHRNISLTTARLRLSTAAVDQNSVSGIRDSGGKMFIDDKVSEGYIIGCACDAYFIVARLGVSVECPHCGNTELPQSMLTSWILDANVSTHVTGSVLTAPSLRAGVGSAGPFRTSLPSRTSMAEPARVCP